MYATIGIIVKEHLKSLEQIDYWVLNKSVYTTAYTIKQYVGELQTTAAMKNKTKETPKWIKNIETSIENTRKFIGRLTIVIACKKSNTYSKNQKRLKDMFEKQFGNTKLQTLEYKLELYKQKLKTSCAKLKYQKILHQWNVINCQFSNNPQEVFHQMKRMALKVEVLPSKNDVEQFWSDIWGNKGDLNQNAEWLKLLETSYCPNAIEKDYSIKADTVKKAIQKQQLKKSPGPDLLMVYGTKGFPVSFLVERKWSGARLNNYF